jgi:hypothetical protein
MLLQCRWKCIDCPFEQQVDLCNDCYLKKTFENCGYSGDLLIFPAMFPDIVRSCTATHNVNHNFEKVLRPEMDWEENGEASRPGTGP